MVSNDYVISSLSLNMLLLAGGWWFTCSSEDKIENITSIRLHFLLLIRTRRLELTNTRHNPDQEVWLFYKFCLGFPLALREWAIDLKCCHTNMSSAYNSTRKKRKGLLCCLLAFLRKSWTKCWISEFIKLVLPFLRNSENQTGKLFLLNSVQWECKAYLAVVSVRL